MRRPIFARPICVLGAIALLGLAGSVATADAIRITSGPRRAQLPGPPAPPPTGTAGAVDPGPAALEAGKLPLAPEPGPDAPARPVDLEATEAEDEEPTPSTEPIAPVDPAPIADPVATLDGPTGPLPGRGLDPRPADRLPVDQPSGPSSARPGAGSPLASDQDASPPSPSDRDEALMTPSDDRDESPRTVASDRDESHRAVASDRDEPARPTIMDRDEPTRTAVADRDEPARPSVTDRDESPRAVASDRDESHRVVASDRDEPQRSAPADRDDRPVVLGDDQALEPRDLGKPDAMPVASEQMTGLPAGRDRSSIDPGLAEQAGLIDELIGAPDLPGPVVSEPGILPISDGDALALLPGQASPARDPFGTADLLPPPIDAGLDWDTNANVGQLISDAIGAEVRRGMFQGSATDATADLAGVGSTLDSPADWGAERLASVPTLGVPVATPEPSSLLLIGLTALVACKADPRRRRGPRP